MRDKMVQKDKVSCTQFVVDMQAAKFGTCVCGAAKADHTDAALSAGGISAKVERDDAEVRARMVQREVADCKEFRLSMADGAAFGTCECGRRTRCSSARSRSSRRCWRGGRRVYLRRVLGVRAISIICFLY